MAKILIVDDEPRIRELIREHLQYAGYVCEEAGDGSAALSLLSGGGFDLVILDVMMPVKDGFTLAREIRQRDERTPIIFLTAKSMKQDTIAGFQAGADDYLTKPFSMEELIMRINAVLKRSRGLAPNGYSLHRLYRDRLAAAFIVHPRRNSKQTPWELDRVHTTPDGTPQRREKQIAHLVTMPEEILGVD